MTHDQDPSTQDRAAHDPSSGAPDDVARRPVLAAGAAAAVAITSFSLPSAFAAASPNTTPTGAYDDSSDGVQGVPAGATADGEYDYRTFTSDGDFVVAGTGTLAVDVLMVGGGGGGGFAYAGGGGGGAVGIERLSLAAGTYPIVVGAGGAGGALDGDATTEGADGGSTRFWAAAPGEQSVPGGRGGFAGPGAAAGGDSPGSGRDPADGSAEQAGGGGAYVAGGGGAGAGGDGVASPDGFVPGSGGVGYPVSDFFGSAVRFAGGGGGGSGPGAPGGAGSDGGGAGGQNAVGLDATGYGAGGGGGGGDNSFNGRSGGRGSDGLVVIRYPAAG